MGLSLGDAFNRRKKLSADLQTWTNRLQQSGADRRWYRTQSVQGDDAFVPDPGTDRETKRHYSIEECRAQIDRILEEDRALAMRISLTNQRARATVVDLAGDETEMSIPELLVLRNDLIPKLEAVARAVPTRVEGLNEIERTDEAIRHREVKKVERKKESFNEHGLKIEEMELLGYDITEITDYGVPRRKAWDEIDAIQAFAQRVKQAINEANKTELVELD